MIRSVFTSAIFSVLFLGILASHVNAQVSDIDRRIAICSAGSSTSIDGELKGRIGEAYEESDVVGDNFVLSQLGSIFKDANAEERVELFKIYTECLKSEREHFQSRGLGYPEPSEAEMLAAHSEQVSPWAIQMFQITYFVKEGCTAIENRGYECSYRIRAGSGGPTKLVVNTFAKTGSNWIMRVE